MTDNKATKYKFMNIYLSKDKYNELNNNMSKNIDENTLTAKVLKFYEVIGEVGNYIANSNSDITLLFYMDNNEFELFCNNSIPYIIKDVIEDISEYRLNNQKYDKIIVPRIIIDEGVSE